MSSERDYGICDQPGPTCPMIDRAISALQEMHDAIEGLSLNPTEDEIVELQKLAAHALSDGASSMEDARGNVIDIRDWGSEWKDMAKSLADDKAELEDKVAELTEELENVTEELRRMEEDDTVIQTHLDLTEAAVSCQH